MRTKDFKTFTSHVLLVVRTVGGTCRRKFQSIRLCFRAIERVGVICVPRALPENVRRTKTNTNVLRNDYVNIYNRVAVWIHA